MKKTLVALALSVVLTGGIAFAGPATDVRGHWAEQDIQRLLSQDVITTFSDGTYRPDQEISRAQYAGFLVRALNLHPSSHYSYTYPDVPKTLDSFRAIEAVSTKGLLRGFPDGEFKPFEKVTRQQAIVSLLKTDKASFPLLDEANSILSRYQDADEVHDWAKPAVALAAKKGMLANKKSGYIEPTRAATRGEVAAFINGYWTENQAKLNIAKQTNTYLNLDDPTLENHQMVQDYLSNIPATYTNEHWKHPLRGPVAILPAQTSFTGTLTTNIDTEFSAVGEQVILNVDRPLISPYNNLTVIPAGAHILGEISEVEPAMEYGKEGKLKINFREVLFPNGRRLPLEASVTTSDGFLKGGELQQKQSRYTSQSTLSRIDGPLSGGNPAKGAFHLNTLDPEALSTKAHRGPEVMLYKGEKLEVTLQKPFTISTQTNAQGQYNR